eukprot:EG_transcript_331
MDVRHPPGMERVTVHVRGDGRRLLLMAVLGLAYALVGRYVWDTMGDPYRATLAEVERIRGRSGNHSVIHEEVGEMVVTATVMRMDFLDDGVEDGPLLLDSEDEGPEEVAGAAGAGAAQSRIPVEDDDDEAEAEQVRWSGDGETSPANESQSTNGSLAASANETATENATETEEPPALPNQWLPSAGACVSLFLLLTGHALFHLLCHWLVWFKALALYAPARAIQAGCFVLVQPPRNRGQPAMAKVYRSERSGRLAFEFQRQVHEFISVAEAEALGDEVVGAGAENGAVVAVPYPIALPVRDYQSSEGLASRAEVDSRQERFGINRLAVQQPRFLELLYHQLLSPIAMFQLFTAVLWLLDEYWQYTLFTLFTIVLLEATTAFQRMRTLGMLSGMATKPYHLQVYRLKEWVTLSTADLLPGDLISVRWQLSGKSTDGSAAAVEVVPCDCVLLAGSAVVNEATLTGESVPQMKDALHTEDPAELARPLDVNGMDRVHVLFSGTSLISTTPAKEGGKSPATPDGGCLAYVLRTGFGSSQGELMRLIEYSTQKVSVDSKETLLALFVLLLFALASAGYVLKQGLEKKDRTTHELLLRCVIIITSVVPRQLPMQMAFAVNTALMALMKNGIFCTEPFRVPYAGKVSYCLFDKTGTLTTDQLMPVGLVNVEPGKAAEDKSAHDMILVKDASVEAAMVLGACHALVSVENVGLVGDPIELAALRGVEWRYDAATQTAQPGNWETKERASAALEEQVKVMAPGPARDQAQQQLETTLQALEAAKAKAHKCPLTVRIVHRFHFSSQLQRMSVVCEVADPSGAVPGGRRALVKGSPEALRTLLVPDSAPPWFDSTYRAMAEQGMRVLALATKPIPSGADVSSRAWVESGLHFAGFIAFACKTRADSETVISALLHSDHRVAMLTGDAPLTALHVAKEVGICDPMKPTVLLTDVEGTLYWEEAIGAERAREAFDVAQMAAVHERYQLMVTEAALEAAAAIDGRLWQEVERICVFARMSPQGKAKVIHALQQHKEHHVLMCGDGGNDVGALKQASVGLALLCGYGNANTAAPALATAEGTSGDKEELLNKQSAEMQQRAEEVMATRKALMAQRQKALMAKQQEWLQEEMRARAARGEPTGIRANVAAMGAVMTRLRDEMKVEAELINKQYPLHGAPAEEAAAGMELQEVIVRPGDASVAAPFTSRIPSVRSVVDLIRQGRCTLLSALQQQQIMMLECIVGAYTLAALSLKGARSSERQMMASGWLLSTASLAFSYSAPVQKMHPVRPLRSLFHPAIFLSILGQAAIHVGCMTYAVSMATTAMGPAKLQEVLDFHKKMKAGLKENGEEMETMEMLMSLWSAPFKPNLLNTVVFLVETAQMVAVLLVNYKGRPWMKGILENHPLFLSLFICVAGVAACAWAVVPEFNALIHLDEFPDDHFRWTVMALVAISLVGTFLWDRLVTAFFSPVIFKAMLDEARSTTVLDVLPAFKTAGKVAVGLVVVGCGNPLVWIVAFLWWRSRRNRPASPPATVGSPAPAAADPNAPSSVPNGVQSSPPAGAGTGAGRGQRPTARRRT